MIIAILGDGSLSKLLGSAWANDRHEIVCVSAASDDLRGVLERADVVFLATPWHANLAAELMPLAPMLKGKTFIDSTNPVDEAGTFSPAAGESFAETLARQFPSTAVVKVADTVSRETLRHVTSTGYPFIHGQPITVFYCGDDALSKRLVAGMIGETAFEPIDVGPLAMARLLEPVGVFAGKLAACGPIGHVISLNAVHELSDHSPLDSVM